MEPNIHRIVQTLYKLRIWRNKEFSITNYYHQLYKILIFVIFFVFIVFFTITFAVGAMIGDSLTESVFLCVVFLALTSVIVNLLTISRNQNEIETILQNIAIDENCAFPDVCRKISKFTKFANYFKLLVAVGTFCFPMSQGLVPYAIWFPLDYKRELISYCITVIYCLFAHVINVIILVYLRLFIWFVMLSSSLQYDILGRRFQRLGQQILDDSIILPELKKCVIIHRRVKKSIDIFQSCFASAFVFQLMTGAICICCPIFLITTVNISVMGCLLYTCLILFMILDILTITYFGNEITIKSNDLSWCIYESNWIDQPIIYKKRVIICMEFFMRPQTLVIGFLFPLDLKTFVSILNSAFSMFNILRNL